MGERVLDIVVAVGTALLAAVTAWLAFDTHRLANSTARDQSLRSAAVVLRECSIASRADARSGDSLIELRARGDKDGFESNDRLSIDELNGYLRSTPDEFLRCEIVNASELPVLNVQLAMWADLPDHRRIRIVSSVFHVIEANGHRTIWFASKRPGKVVVHAPDRVRFSSYESNIEASSASLTVRIAQPILNDRWGIERDREVGEDLDQREMKSF